MSAARPPVAGEDPGADLLEAAEIVHVRAEQRHPRHRGTADLGEQRSELLVFGRGSWARELAFDDAVLRAHLARSSQP